MSRRALPASTWMAILAVLLAGAAPLAAQGSGSVQGVVVDQKTRAPLVGAQVYVQGTNLGTLTNEEGRYLLLNVPPGAHRVRVQRIGYSMVDQAVTVEAGAAATANFQLAETALALDEIVVTGTAATVRKKEVGNSMEAITAREVRNAPVANSQDVLQGRAPGVTIMTNSGQPGAGGTIKIRGVNTVSQAVAPLIYVDGIRIANEAHRAGWGGQTETNPLQDIVASDIERIEVVKGAAATTLYGTEASGGVIQVFTKKGAAGDPVWTADLSTGANVAPKFGRNDPSQFYTKCGSNELLYGIIPTGDDKGQRLYFEDPTCPADGDWQRAGAYGSLAVSVRGGTERVTYFVSGNGSTSDAYLPTGNSKEGGFRGNVTFAPADPVKLSLNTSYQRRNTRWVGDGNNSEGFFLDVGRGPFGYMLGGKEGDCDNVSEDKVCVTNGYLFEDQFYNRSDHFVSGLTVEYSPLQNFLHRFSVGWDYTYIYDETTLPFGYLTLPEGYYWKEDSQHQKLSLDYAGSWNASLSANVTSSLSWGGQLFRDRHRWSEVDVQSFAGPGKPTLESGASVTYLRDRPFAETNAGFFLQELVGFQDRLFLTAGLRVDGNSAFGSNFGLQPYPKASLAWVLSDYSFFPSGAVWDAFKLRAAVGQSGKAPGAFDKLRTWSPVSGDEGEPGFAPENVGNADVGPERTTELEAGFDAGFFSGRIGLEFTAFRATTNDALVPVNLPASEGFLADRIENVGKLRSEGLEASATLGLIRTDNFDWRVRASGSVLRSEVVDLGPGSIEDPQAHMISTGLLSYMKVGYAAPSYYGSRIDNPNERAVPIVVDDSLSEIGPVFPTRELSLGTTVTLLKNVTLDALMEFQGGHYLPNYTGYQSARRGAWHPCLAYQEDFLNDGDVSGYTALERARCAPNGTSLYDIAWWVEKADFWKLRSASITYELPPRLIPWARTASLSLAGRNLLSFSDYTGTDPEVSTSADQFNLVGNAGQFGRRDYYQIPPGRTFLVTLRTTF
jgi:TonB-dependent starch-binding outer membrane protein SusC